MACHSQPIDKVLKDLGTTAKGLTSEKAEERLKQFGQNKLEEEKKISPLRIFCEQFVNPIVWILLAAIVVSAIVREWADVSVIGAIVVLNAILGFIQEFRAEEAIAHLKKLISLKAKVLRNGTETIIDAINLVPGDVVLLATGDKVPADCRLIEILNLQTQEAALTGESTPVEKKTDIVKEHAPVADMTNMVFSGTIVTRGKAKAVVATTGMKTQIGHIAKLIKEAKTEPTPLQTELAKLSKLLGIAVIIIAAVVFGAGVLYEKPMLEMFLAAIALAVAAIPEGLPAVVTISLAMGVQRMTKHNALVRKLPSVETLGACTVICSDKTGTLTHNEMTVKKIFANQEAVSVTGSGYSPEGRFTKDSRRFAFLLTIGALNNDALLRKEAEEWKVIGDPTEAALLVSAKKAGLDKEKLEHHYPRAGEIEFTSERKRMTTIHKNKGGLVAFTKGAPEEIIKLCNRQLVNGRIVRFSKKDKEEALIAASRFADNALRVLGFAYKELQQKEASVKTLIEKDMVFVGLQAMIDPPRKEVKEAIEKCRTAGIKVVMITGDHLKTATAIAKELGISGKSMTGTELDHVQDLSAGVKDIGVYARVNPAHKIRIIEAFKKHKDIVAMTGDGVNDAPALKKADLGIAMGITGTDVAKEAGEMILADDNFANIVRAVEEGRRIFDNIQKFVVYLLSSNMGEILTLFIGILLGWPLPVTALMILWINLATDGLPALALSIDPAEKGTMQRKPRKVGAHIVNKMLGLRIFLIGMIMMLGTLFVFDWYDPLANLPKAQTMAFTVLVLFQMFNVLNQRSETKSLFQVGIFKNRWLWGAILISVGLQFAVVYLPFMQNLFNTVALTAKDWLIATGVSASVLVFGEIMKLFSR